MNDFIPWRERLLVTMRETQQILGLSHPTIYKLINEKKIRAGKFRGRTMVHVDSLLKYVEEADDI